MKLFQPITRRCDPRLRFGAHRGRDKNTSERAALVGKENWKKRLQLPY